MNILVTIGILFLGISSIKPSPITNEKSPLRFNSEGKFKIVQFADLHYGEFPGFDRGRFQDGNSTRVMNTILDYEKPEFVVFTGDLISADLILANSGRFINAIFSSIQNKGYRWASTYGNHDNGISTTREQVFSAETKFPNSYTTHGPSDVAGVTNFYLPVFGESGDTPLVMLWFFDSRGGFDPSGVKPSTVDETVVEWFKTEDKKVGEKWGKIPALAFFHIPTLDYKDVQADMENRYCVGLVGERVVPQGRDTGFMEALLNSNVLTTFVGHDHGNSWCCEYKTLQICYNRRTGYGGYGDWDRGARVVELDLSKDIWSQRANYVRLENGTIIEEFNQPKEP